jgi:predicted nucleic acid-binding protein
LLSASDSEHGRAARTFERLLTTGERLVTHNYVVVEACAIVQRRLGIEALRVLRDDLLPVVTIEWVDRALHDQALAATIAAARRDVSVVDRVSFELMRGLGIRVAFAFDDDFEREGFSVAQR